MVTLIAERTRTAANEPFWKIRYQLGAERNAGWQDANVIQGDDARLTFEIPIVQPTPPGIRARLRVVTRFWNDWH